MLPLMNSAFANGALVMRAAANERIDTMVEDQLLSAKKVMKLNRCMGKRYCLLKYSALRA